MAIKRREKPLTLAEATELAKREFTPYWFGTPEALMAGVRAPDGVKAYPLDSKMTDRPWVLCFIDPFSLSARECISYARSWAKRYEAQKLGVMLICKLPYAFSQVSEWGHRFSQQFQEPVITVMDHQGLLHEAFQAQSLPKLILMQQNSIIFSKQGESWLAGAELEIQQFLRKSDPGLPLFEVIPQPEQAAIDLLAADFVGMNGAETSFDLPGEKKLVISGKWNYEPARITTQDPHATIEFSSSGKRVAMVAQALLEKGDSEMIVELQREYPRESGLDDDLILDIQILTNPLADQLQKRRAQAKIGPARTYYLFRSLGQALQPVVLRFPNADKAPVAVYGLRLGD